jgi:hypothetical protein
MHVKLIYKNLPPPTDKKVTFILKLYIMFFFSYTLYFLRNLNVFSKDIIIPKWKKMHL